MIRKIFRFLFLFFAYPVYLISLLILLPIYGFFYGITRAWNDFENLGE